MMLVREPDGQTLALTTEERARAEKIGVYRINAHGKDSFGWPGAFLAPVAVGLTREEVWKDVERLGDLRLPEWEDFRISGPWILLPLHDDGVLDANVVRGLLARVDGGERHERSEPLTLEERARAEGMQVYYVWYRDTFQYGYDRDSHPVAICLYREDAEVAVRRTGGPPKPGGDGYEIVGPASLLITKFRSHARGVVLVREVLRCVDTGERVYTTVPVELW